MSITSILSFSFTTKGLGTQQEHRHTHTILGAQTQTRLQPWLTKRSARMSVPPSSYCQGLPLHSCIASSGRQERLHSFTCLILNCILTSVSNPINSAIKSAVVTKSHFRTRSMLCTYPPENTGDTSNSAATISKKFNTPSPPISHRLFLFNLSPPLCPSFQLLVVLCVGYPLNNFHSHVPQT